MRYDLAIISGYFNPLHVGHLDYIEAAKRKTEVLVAIVNSDEQVKLKGSIPFMKQEDRLRILNHLRAVDVALLSNDKTPSVCDDLTKLRLIHPDLKMVFITGADHTPENTKAERKVCEKLGIDIIYGAGGEKVQSSSALLENVK